MESQQISSDLIRGHIDTIILHSLIDNDKFAQQISDSIEQKSNGDYKINQATLYSSLKRLESLKLVSSYWFDAKESGGRRKYFKITEDGIKTVNNNLDNWTFSRALIDKLVDCQPEPIYRTQYIEKIIEIPVERTNNNNDATVENKNFNALEQKAEQPAINTTPINNNSEINYRNILNGLIKIDTQKNTESSPVEILSEECTNNSSDNNDNIEKLKFNETISSAEFNLANTHNNGKIDFGDLVLNESKEGYKVRISSRDSALSTGKILINKLNFISSLVLFAILLLEFVSLTIFCKELLDLSTFKIILAAVCISCFPIITTILFIKNPTKKLGKDISPDIILVSALVVFNLIIVNFAIAILCNMNFANISHLLTFIIIPIALYLDLFIYFTVKFFLSKHKAVKIINKK